MERDAFVFYRSYYEAAAELSAKDRYKLYDAIIEYALYGKEPPLNGIIKALFISIKPTVDAGMKRKNAAKKAAEMRWHDANAYETHDANASHKPDANAYAEETKRIMPNKEQEINNEKQGINNKGYTDSPELSSEPPVITLPLNDGSEYPITEFDVEGWNASYPAVDVMQQLRNMREWLLSNPTRKKTKTGIRRFITTWLAREQDRGGTRGQPAARSGTTERQGITRNDDIDALVRNKVLEGL